MPFSQGEIDGTHENFLDIALTDPDALTVPNRHVTEREEYEQRTCRGAACPWQFAPRYDDVQTSTART